MPLPRRRLPYRFLAAWLALALLASGTGVWLAQILGPRHVHAAPALEDFRHIVPGHPAVAHGHADVRSHVHDVGTELIRFGPDDSTELLDAALAALAVLIPVGRVAEPVAIWRSTTRTAKAEPVPASHDAEPDPPPPRLRTLP
jgi:hypothetical protein